MTTKASSYAKSRQLTNNNRGSLIYWSLFLCVIIFLIWSPFQRALFNGGTVDFERPIYSSLVWSAIILLLIALYSFFFFRLTEVKDLLTISILLLPLTYFISLVHAASHYLATNMVYIQLLYATFFLLGIFLTKSKFGTSGITFCLMLSGYLIVLFGLLYFLGNASIANYLFGWFAITDSPTGAYRDVVMSTEDGLRLTSVFQYANTYASFLIALMLAAVFFIVRERKWYYVLPHALMLVPTVVSFWLTLSRGALVIIPVVFVIMLFFMSISRQIISIVQLALAFIISLAILSRITSLGTALQKQPIVSLSVQGWITILLASIVFTTLAILIQLKTVNWIEQITARFSKRKFAVITLPVTAIALAMICGFLLFNDTGFKNLLPDYIKTRIENINFQQHSVLERGTFYRDALKLWKDYPVIGAGGGAWASLYEKYQNNPYTSRQAHNFALQYLVESGALGFLAFVAFVVAIFYFYIRSFIAASVEKRDERFLFFILTVALLAHSMIDFDLSYVYMGAVLFLCLGVMLSGSESAPVRIRSDSLALHKAFPGVLLVLSVVLFIISTRLLAANNSYQHAVALTKTSQNYNEIVAPLDQAIKLHPNHPDFVLTGQMPDGRSFSKISLLLQMYSQTKNEQYFTDAQNLLNDLEKAEPHNRLVAYQQLNFLQAKGKVPEALAWASQQLSNYPWYTEMYESKISLSVELGNQARAKGDMKSTDSYFTGAVDTYNKMLQQIDSLKNLPKGQEQGRPFEVTPMIALNIGEVDYMRSDYAAAAALMKAHLSANMDDQLNKTMARWYLAALQKQGQNDQNVYNQLIAKDPQEKDNIASIVATNYAVK